MSDRPPRFDIVIGPDVEGASSDIFQKAFPEAPWGFSDR